MELERPLGAPIQLAKFAGVKVPRIQTLYAMLRHINTVNKDRPVNTAASTAQLQSPTAAMQAPPRTISLSSHGAVSWYTDFREADLDMIGTRSASKQMPHVKTVEQLENAVSRP